MSSKPKTDAQKASRLNLKEMMKDESKKGYFRSHGYSVIKVTRIDENGEMKEEFPEIEIYPLGDHPVLKLYHEKYPAPEAPKTMRLINICGARPNFMKIAPLMRAYREEPGIEPLLVVGQEIESPIAIDAELLEPSKVGTDRLCAAAGAYAKVNAACVVADFGTALTIDLVADNGIFLGGTILPGVALSAKALHEHTAQLPLVEVGCPAETLGKDTQSAIRNGIYAMFCLENAHDIKEKKSPYWRTDANPSGRMTEAVEFVEMAEQAGIPFMLATQRRFIPSYARLKEIADNLGDVFLARGQYVFRWNRDFAWRGQWETAGGGALHDMGYHTVDMLIWYLGMPDWVSTEWSSRAFDQWDYSTDDTAITMFGYNSGTIGYLLTTWATSPSEEAFFLHGKRGVAVADRSGIRHTDLADNVVEDIPASGEGDGGLHAQMAHFAHCIRTGEQPLTAARTNLENMAFIEAAYRSAAEEARVLPKDYLPE